MEKSILIVNNLYCFLTDIEHENLAERAMSNSFNSLDPQLGDDF